MARPVNRKRAKRRRSEDRSLPLAKTNYILLVVGVGIIVIGYLFMLEGSVDGIMPIVIAPILLITGYCIIIPFALLYRPKEGADEKTEAASQS
jgi:hypothetical protein